MDDKLDTTTAFTASEPIRPTRRPFDYKSYKSFIERELMIISKDGHEVPFNLKKAQDDFIQNITGRDLILKCRQLGFSALILAIGTAKFILGKNERIVCISHETTATQRLLDRVKYYLSVFERKNGIKIPMKYNSRNEMAIEGSNNTFYIGSAGSSDIGRGDTITMLHLSEFFFYDDPQKLFAGVMQAVVPNGLIFIESTANGFNYGREFWQKTKMDETGFKAHFYDPSWEYSEEFLTQKKKELDNLYAQEYPKTDVEAFITSGNMYFSSEALNWYLNNVKDPITHSLIF